MGCAKKKQCKGCGGCRSQSFSTNMSVVALVIRVAFITSRRLPLWKENSSGMAEQTRACSS